LNVIGQLKYRQGRAELSSHFLQAFFVAARPYALSLRDLQRRKMPRPPIALAAGISPLGGWISLPTDNLNPMNEPFLVQVGRRDLKLSRLTAW
jgi:hypothetical protein